MRIEMTTAMCRKRKAPGLLAGKTGRQLTTTAKYYALSIPANLFGAIYWWFEQKRFALQDGLDNEEAQQ